MERQFLARGCHDFGGAGEGYSDVLVVGKGRYEMNRHRALQGAAVLGVAVTLAGILLAQGTPGKQLVVNGKTTNAVVLQVGGRSYVDVDTLAQITNGSVTIAANQILLTIPNSNPGANSSADAAAAQAPPGLSRNFASAAIATVSDMK